MEAYLKEFHRELKRYEGSLVKVSSANRLDKNAKEYLSKLAKEGAVERAAWGWYYVKPRKSTDLLGFLRQDRNFKAIIGQSAASFWNQDFIHRESLSVMVDSLSFRKALESFAKKKGWEIAVDYSKNPRKSGFAKIKGLYVEGPDMSVIECMKKWAFVDAVAVLAAWKDRLDWKRLARDSYWSRISGTGVRVRQAIEYAASRLKIKAKNFRPRKTRIKDSFVRQELDEAIEKVLDFE
jgi:hypothetical protein